MVEYWLCGNESNRSRHRARPVQGALRSWKHLNSLHIADIHIKISAARSDRLLIKIQGDVGRGPLGLGNGNVDRVNRSPSDVDLVLTWTSTARVNIREILHVVSKFLDVLIL